MELKDKLKLLRQQQGLTQAQLAEKLFVSRSTVAKWENGLGLPSEDSMTALETLFDIQKDDVATTEPEAVIVAKNRRLYIIGQIALWTLMFALTVVMAVLPFAIHKGYYGFTPEMLAGGFADEKYIDTGDYRFYYFQFEGSFEDGRVWAHLQGWKPIHKHFWGCTVSEEDYAYRVVTKDNYVVARLYTVEGKHGYYNILLKMGIYTAGEDTDAGMTWAIPPELIVATEITIGREVYQLEDGFFFITDEPVEFFEINEEWYDVE